MRKKARNMNQQMKKERETKSLFKEIYNTKYLSKFTEIENNCFWNFGSWVILKDKDNIFQIICILFTTYGCSRNTRIIKCYLSQVLKLFCIFCYVNEFDVCDSNVFTAQCNAIIINNT